MRVDKIKENQWLYTPISENFLESWEYITKITKDSFYSIMFIKDTDERPPILRAINDFKLKSVSINNEYYVHARIAEGGEKRLLLRELFRTEIQDEREY